MNALRVSFLVATDIAVVAMLVSLLLAGCVATPSQYRNGDFVSHMAAAAESVSRDRTAARPAAQPADPPASQVARG